MNLLTKIKDKLKDLENSDELFPPNLDTTCSLKIIPGYVSGSLRHTRVQGVHTST